MVLEQQTSIDKTNKKINLAQTSRLFTETNLKLIMGLKVKSKNIKLLEDNVGENLEDLGFSSEFLDTTPKTWSVKKKLMNWTYWN